MIQTTTSGSRFSSSSSSSSSCNKTASMTTRGGGGGSNSSSAREAGSEAIEGCDDDGMRRCFNKLVKFTMFYRMQCAMVSHIDQFYVCQRQRTAVARLREGLVRREQWRMNELAGQEAEKLVLLHVRAHYALEKLALRLCRARWAGSKFSKAFDCVLSPVSGENFSAGGGSSNSGSSDIASDADLIALSSSRHRDHHNSLSPRERNHRVCIDLHSMSRGLGCLKGYIKRRRGISAENVEMNRHARLKCQKRCLRRFLQYSRGVSAANRASMAQSAAHFDATKLVRAIDRWAWFKTETAARLAAKRAVIDKLKQREGDFQAISNSALVKKYGSYLNIMNLMQISGFLWRMSFLLKTFSRWRSVVRAIRHDRRKGLIGAMVQLVRSGALRRMERRRDLLCLGHCDRWKLSICISRWRVHARRSVSMKRMVVQVLTQRSLVPNFSSVRGHNFISKANAKAVVGLNHPSSSSNSNNSHNKENIDTWNPDPSCFEIVYVKGNSKNEDEGGKGGKEEDIDKKNGLNDTEYGDDDYSFNWSLDSDPSCSETAGTHIKVDCEFDAEGNSVDMSGGDDDVPPIYSSSSSCDDDNAESSGNNNDDESDHGNSGCSETDMINYSSKIWGIRDVSGGDKRSSSSNSSSSSSSSSNSSDYGECGEGNVGDSEEESDLFIHLS